MKGLQEIEESPVAYKIALSNVETCWGSLNQP